MPQKSTNPAAGDRRARQEFALWNASPANSQKPVPAQDRPHYDADDDINKSLKACYDAIRARKAAGGPGWGAP
jgi:hypothetical protein